VEASLAKPGKPQPGARPHLFRRDLGWAAFILGAAALIGLLHHWQLVQISWRGELRPYLEKRQAQQRQVVFQGVKTVNLEQAHTIFQEGKAMFVDARPPEEYGELHIPGAVNLTADALGNGLPPAVAGVPRDRPLVVYCGQVSCDAALKVAEGLQSLGFTQVTAFLGGFRAWDEAGYPADTSK
jgi:rhodanese-related sulfurtransferase